MKKLLITGGTAFVSQYAAAYFVERGYDVYVLNRNRRPQVEGVTLIRGDRHCLGDALKHTRFDIVADITAYDARDIVDLHGALGSFDQYLLISSSAVYPEDGAQPFREDSRRAANAFWGKYGADKIEADVNKKPYLAYIITSLRNAKRIGFPRLPRRMPRLKPVRKYGTIRFSEPQSGCAGRRAVSVSARRQTGYDTPIASEGSESHEARILERQRSARVPDQGFCGLFQRVGRGLLLHTGD